MWSGFSPARERMMPPQRRASTNDMAETSAVAIRDGDGTRSMRKRRDWEPARRLDTGLDFRLPMFKPGHQEADLLRIGRTRRHDPHDPPVEQDRYPIRKRKQLVEILGDEKDGRATLPLVA